MTKIDVIPTKDSAKMLVHPVNGLLGEGAKWDHDTFTSRRLTDGSITRGVPKSADEKGKDERAAEAKAAGITLPGPIEAQARAAATKAADPTPGAASDK